MPITIDDSQVLAGLTTLLPRIATGIEGGLRDAATVAEYIMQTSPAHGDESGAAHASSVATLIGGSSDAQSDLDRAYGIAESKLSGFTEHDGQPAHVDAPTLPATQRGVLLARPVDYAENLENEGKAVVGPTLLETAQLMTRLAAEGSKAVLG